MSIITPQPLSPETFAPFGDVIQAGLGEVTRVNEGRADRFDSGARLDRLLAETTPVVAIYRIDASPLPLRIPRLERHPLSSQLFVPMTASRYLVVTVPSDIKGDPVPAEAAAFVATGSQAINYQPGVWHCPLVALDQPADFAMSMGRAINPDADCQFFDLPAPLTVGQVSKRVP
jgi:ureidoglycolate lyase